MKFLKIEIAGFEPDDFISASDMDRHEATIPRDQASPNGLDEGQESRLENQHGLGNHRFFLENSLDSQQVLVLGEAVEETGWRLHIEFDLNVPCCIENTVPLGEMATSTCLTFRGSSTGSKVITLVAVVPSIGDQMESAIWLAFHAQ
jgi:hypothetical protein